MPQTPHTERHFHGGRHGARCGDRMSDGLTVPFALAAGLSGAASSTGIIITAGLAEVTAGAIAMGLGGYLAAKVMPSITRANVSERSRKWLKYRNRKEVKSQSYFVPMG